MSFVQTLLLTCSVVCSVLAIVSNQKIRGQHIVLANTELSAGRLAWLAVCRLLGLVVELHDPPPWDSPDAHREGVTRRLDESQASICSLVRAVDGLASHMEKTVNVEHLAELKELATRAKYVPADGGKAVGWSESAVKRFHGAATIRVAGLASIMIAAPNRAALTEYLEREGIDGHNPDAFDDVTITKRGQS